MTELSLYVLDIVQNSITAKAQNIVLSLLEQNHKLVFTLTDDGCGMSEEFLSSVLDPFTTTRTTRRVGLGLPLLQLAAQQTGGDLTLTSAVGKGTTLTVVFYTNHIDMVPMGDLPSTMSILVQGAPQVHFTLHRARNDKSYTVDTVDMQAMLGDDVPLNDPDVLAWLTAYMTENEQELEEELH